VLCKESRPDETLMGVFVSKKACVKKKREIYPEMIEE
jgi:hypothetical protein